MSVKRKSDAGGKSENVKQLKVPKPKKEEDLETKKILQTNNPDVSNGKVKKIKKEKLNENKRKRSEAQNDNTNETLNESKKQKNSANLDQENMTNEKPTEKKEGAHERREKKKKLKSERQTKKKKDETVVDLGTKAKLVWNKVRGDDCPENERENLLNELHGLVKGNLNKVWQSIYYSLQGDFYNKRRF